MGLSVEVVFWHVVASLKEVGGVGYPVLSRQGAEAEEITAL